MLSVLSYAYNYIRKKYDARHVCAMTAIYTLIKTLLGLNMSNPLSFLFIAGVLSIVAAFLAWVQYQGYLLGGYLGDITGLLLLLYLGLLFPILPWLIATLVGFGAIIALYKIYALAKAEWLPQPTEKNASPSHQFTNALRPVDFYVKQDTPHLLYGMTQCLLFHA